MNRENVGTNNKKMHNNYTNEKICIIIVLSN